MVGPIKAAEVRSARAEEKARVESVMKARGTKVQHPKANSGQSTIRRKKTRPKSDVRQGVSREGVQLSSLFNEEQCSQGGEVSSGLVGDRKNSEVEEVRRESGARTVRDTSDSADLGPGPKVGHREEDFGDLNAAVEKEVEAVNPSASVEEEVGTGDTRAAVEKEVGAEDKGAAEEEDVGARDKGAAEEEEVGAGDKNVEDSRPSVAGRFPDFSTTATRVTKVRASDVFNEDNDSGLEVEQQSTWAASEEQGGQGSLQSSPRSTGDQLTAAEVSSDQ